jgi:hypothetical protein
MTTAPVVVEHEGVHVVRDDLFPGGTKARYIPRLFDSADEIVYASPAEGGAQYALAHVARALGKRATIFCAERAEQHPRQHQACALGAKVVLVRPGYLSVVQARAKAYCAKTGATLAPFGMEVEGAHEAIAEAARATGLKPAEVWCAAGSATLAQGLMLGWPEARHCLVQVGRAIDPAISTRPCVHQVHVHSRKFEQRARRPRSRATGTTTPRPGKCASSTAPARA